MLRVRSPWSVAFAQKGRGLRAFPAKRERARAWGRGSYIVSAVTIVVVVVVAPKDKAGFVCLALFRLFRSPRKQNDVGFNISVALAKKNEKDCRVFSSYGTEDHLRING